MLIKGERILKYHVLILIQNFLIILDMIKRWMQPITAVLAAAGVTVTAAILLKTSE